MVPKTIAFIKGNKRQNYNVVSVEKKEDCNIVDRQSELQRKFHCHDCVQSV